MILTIILVFIYIIVGNNFLHIFTTNFMFDTREVKVYGKTYIEGKLRWDIIKNISILLIYIIYTISFIISDVINMRKFFKFENVIISEIHDRIRLLKNRQAIDRNPQYLGIDNEVIELVKERDAAIKQNKEQKIQHSQSMAFLAHDLKTPLTSIVGYVSLLLDEPNISEQNKRKYLNIIGNKSQELEELINQFFNLAKYQIQASSLRLKEVDLLNLLIQMKETFYPQITKKDLRFEVDIDEPILLLVDQDLVARAFYNIIKNAIQYTESRGKIRIYTTKDLEYQSVIIENDVIDINGGQALNLFQPFYRLDQSRNKSVEGSGLGLAISKEIIEKHNGKISSVLAEETLKIVVDFTLEMTEN